MRFEMKNLTSFPMEKVCFDLKLEALEQMEPWDMYELAKVNQGFQGMLVRDQSIILGEHVYRIRLNAFSIEIVKFSNSRKIELNLNHPFHFSFVKKIRSCDHFDFRRRHQCHEEYTLLNNLKSVNELELLRSSKEALERFYSNFHASIQKKATFMGFNDFNDRSENFLVGSQLKDCEKIWFYCLSEDSFRFCYNALSKSQIKNVVMRLNSGDFFDLIIQQIIINGIPSKHPEAAILLGSFACAFGFTIDLSQYPGMRRIDGENRLRLLKQANYLWSLGYYGSGVFMEESSIFRRDFDSTKDCICVYNKGYTEFLAYYIPVD